MDDLQWIRDVKVVELDINSDLIITGVYDIDQFNEKLIQLYGQERIDYTRRNGPVPNYHINTMNNKYINQTVERGTTVSIRVNGTDYIIKTGWISNDTSPNYFQERYGIKNEITFDEFLTGYKK